MAGSIARHPYKIGLILLLLAGLVSGLLILQASFSTSDSTNGETGSEQQLSLGSEISESGSDAGGPAATAPGSPRSPGPSTTAPVSVPAVITTGAPAALPVTVPPVDNPINITGPPAGDENGGQAPGPESGGRISGLAQDETAQPQPGIYVYLADAEGSLIGDYQVTDAEGRFDFAGLSSGSYKLYFTDPSGYYESGWYGNVGSPIGAQIQVGAGGVTSIVQTLVPSSLPEHGTFTGRVTSSCGGGAPPACAQGLPGVVVSAFLLEENGSGMTLRGTSVSDSSGYYRLDNLPPGDYKISFNPPGESFAYQWYNGQQSIENAEIVPLQPGQTVGKIDASLSEGGYISGEVGTEAGPLALARVDIFDKAGVIVDTMLTGSDGSYQSGPLPEGSYRIRVSPPTGEYLGEWYDNEHDFASANVVTVNGGTASSGINIELELAMKISATPDLVTAGHAPGVEPVSDEPGYRDPDRSNGAGDGGSGVHENEGDGQTGPTHGIPPSTAEPGSHEHPHPPGSREPQPGAGRAPADRQPSDARVDATPYQTEHFVVTGQHQEHLAV
jgi:hypothetical protein